MAKVQGTLVYTGKHHDRLNVLRTVSETVRKLTGNQGNICIDHVYEELAVQDASITRMQVQAALSTMARIACSKYIKTGLKYIGNGWYSWNK